MSKLNRALMHTIILIVVPTLVFNITGSHLATGVAFVATLIAQETRS